EATRVARRPHSTGPASKDPGHKHRDLDPGPNEPDAEPGSLDKGDPNAVAWPSAQPCADVQRSSQTIADDTGQQQRDASPHLTGCGNECDARIVCQSDEEDIQHG